MPEVKISGQNGEIQRMPPIVQWLEELGLGQYSKAFVDAGIDFSVLSNLAEADLEKLGVALGDCKTILRAIGELPLTKTIQPLDISAATPSAPRPREVKHRHLTHLISRVIARPVTGTRWIETEAIISDRRFIAQLDQVRALKEFLFEEKVRFKDQDITKIDLEGLNSLQFGPEGRFPHKAEWRLLDIKLAALASYLNDDLRRRIRIRELRIFYGMVPKFFYLARWYLYR
jgi:hypothetical protein